jgi:hypothetical protein
MSATGRALLWSGFAVALFMAGCSGDAVKRSINAMCSGNEDCADNICHHGMCASSNPSQNGQPCNGNGNCRSFLCIGGVCQPGTAPLGKACRNSEECKSKSCASQLCSAALPIPDGGVDSGSDGPTPDAPRPDAAADLSPDIALPDGPVLDLPLPDLPVPDLTVPDLLPSPDGGCATCYSKWTPITPVTGTWRNWSVAAQDQVVLIGGQVSFKNGEIRRSEKGQAFQKVASTTSHVTGIAMEGLKAVAVDADGWIRGSSDGGKTWSVFSKRCWQYAAIGDIAMLGQFIVATSKGTICWSSDGGTNFSNKAVMSSPYQGVNLKAVSMAVVNGKPTAIVVGDYKDNSYKFHHYIFHSSNQGKTWDDLSAKLSGATGYSLNDVHLHSDGKVFMSGEDGFVHISSDTGKTWQHVTVSTKALRTVFFDPAMNAVLVSGTSEAYLSTKGGFLFNKLTDPNLTGALYKVAANGLGTLYLAEMYKDAGKLLKSSR